ncbi:MAG: sigma-70 family RNA polymerase sigma factor [Lachnospiraceae bacterium]|nr:sigma-70 family RNA polymerase sigma factor [Lachnospiraceae bacterium]
MKTPKELAEAVRTYQGGDQKSFNLLYELSYPYLYTCIMHVMKDEEGAADMIQETYLEISQNIRQLRNPEDFLSWASTIGNRKCYARLKKQKDVLVYSDHSEDAQDFFESIADDEAFIPEAILQDREKQRLIREIVDSLSEMQRLCIIGFYYREQSLTEIAQELEIPVNTVKSHLSRAKSRMKDAIVALDEEKGTRLYSIAPFMLLFLSKEVEACETAPMSETLTTELEKRAMKDAGRGIKDVAKGVAKTGMQYKLAAGAILAAVIIGGSAALMHSADSPKNVVEGSGTETISGEAEMADAGAANGKDAGAVKLSDMESDHMENPAATEEVSEAEEQPETKELLEETLVFDLSEYESFGHACGGVIPVKKNGLWGAVDYDKKEIVACSYSGFWKMPNLSGYFVLTDNSGGVETYILFAPDGTKVYEGTDEVMASGNFYAIRLDPSNDAYGNWEGAVDYYDYHGNKVLSTTYLDGTAFLSPVSGAYDGKTPVRRQRYRASDHGIVMEGGILYADGTVVWDEEPYQEDSTEGNSVIVFHYPLGTPNHGYTVENNMLYENGAISVYTEDRSRELYHHLSYITYNGERLVESYNEGYDWTGFVYDGGRVSNYGSHMVWIMNGRHILVDLTRTDMDMIQAVYDDIVLSMESYWLVQKGERWGYIDHDGNEVAMYDDASEFANGYALIIDSGNACLINEKFEIVEECGPADRVSGFGELLGMEKDGMLSLIHILN